MLFDLLQVYTGFKEEQRRDTRHSGAARNAEPGIQPRMQRSGLDSGFAGSARAPE
ncbi:hypothetical protein J2S22_002165 [Rhodoplanes tepidamans]|nr:hypothetical protein [Rhodoplanes tepidamans]